MLYVLVNLKTKEAKRHLDDHFSTSPELPLVINGKPWTNVAGNIPMTASDGIVINKNNEYYHDFAKHHALGLG
ncbi:MAG: hypothetical protein K9I94_14590 [Bacteroidales bacterium]|nr:hypothetical protein [Bacteroidales bacterium]